LGEARLATICFRHDEAGDAFNRNFLTRINATGRLFLTGTQLKGKYVLRLALGHPTTTEADVRGAWDTIQQVGR
jgi:aromatic-L-amino-acid decarboxylase